MTVVELYGWLSLNKPSPFDAVSFGNFMFFVAGGVLLFRLQRSAVVAMVIGSLPITWNQYLWHRAWDVAPNWGALPGLASDGAILSRLAVVLVAALLLARRNREVAQLVD